MEGFTGKTAIVTGAGSGSGRTIAKRLGCEGERKGAVVFLCSPAADFITGHIVNIDGGATIR